jgi:phospholipid-binding lipoprotein MlaA
MFYFFKNIRAKFFVLLLTLVIPISSYSADTENDPFEGTNRNIFKFNNVLDDNFFKPVAKGWRKIPDIPRKPLSNLASTAQAPISLANAILQLNRESIGNILGKFLINMTFGLGGMFDIAGTQEFGSMPTVIEDFGQTLATWGVPDGPYVMLPIFGPSSVRDSFGLGVDTVFNPLSFAYRMNNIGLEARLSGPTVRGVTTREKYLDYVDEMKASSLDFYATMRSLYRQKRKKEISGELEESSSLLGLPIKSTENREQTIDETEISTEVSIDQPEVTDEKPKKVAEVKVPSSNIKKMVKSSAKNDVGLMPSSNYPGARNISGYAPRVYNGLMPSSTYPGFSRSRVNLIE